MARGYLPWLGGTYLGQGVPTLARGYLPWLGVPTLAGGVPTLAGRDTPQLGVPTLAGGTYLGQGIPTLAGMGYPPGVNRHTPVKTVPSPHPSDAGGKTWTIYFKTRDT